MPERGMIPGHFKFRKHATVYLLDADQLNDLCPKLV